MSLAYSAWDMRQLTDGNFVLGLGSQVRGHIVRRFGMPWSAPTERMEEFIAAIRAIWTSWTTGDRLEFEGTHYSHTLMSEAFAPHGSAGLSHPPIALAGVGPRMIELAGRVADGFLAHPFNTSESVEATIRPALQKGLESAGRSADEVEVTLQFLGVMGGTEAEYESSRSAAQRQLAFYASTPAYEPVLETMGLVGLGRELQELAKEREWEKLPGLIDDEVLRAFCVVGTPAEIASQIEERCRGIAHRATVIQAMNSLPDDDEILSWHRSLRD